MGSSWCFLQRLATRIAAGSPSSVNRARVIARVAFSVTLLLFFLPTSAPAQVNLQWDANIDSDLAGYNVYLGQDDVGFSDLVVIATIIGTPATPTSTVSRATLAPSVPGQTHVLAVTAFDTSGNESGFLNTFSNTVVLHAPVADAGPDQAANAGDTVPPDGSPIVPDKLNAS